MGCGAAEGASLTLASHDVCTLLTTRNCSRGDDGDSERCQLSTSWQLADSNCWRKKDAPWVDHHPSTRPNTIPIHLEGSREAPRFILSGCVGPFSHCDERLSEAGLVGWDDLRPGSGRTANFCLPVVARCLATGTGVGRERRRQTRVAERTGEPKPSNAKQWRLWNVRHFRRKPRPTSHLSPRLTLQRIVGCLSRFTISARRHLRAPFSLLSAGTTVDLHRTCHAFTTNRATT